MKRNEMIREIKSIIATCGPTQPTIETAKQILDRIEAIGMRPPRLEEDKCQAIMDVYYAGYSLNQWDEDFEKDEKVVEKYKRRLEYKALTPEERLALLKANAEKRMK